MIICKQSWELDVQSLFYVWPVMRSSPDHSSTFAECLETSVVSVGKHSVSPALYDICHHDDALLSPWCVSVIMMLSCHHDALLTPWRAPVTMLCSCHQDVLLSPWRAPVTMTCSCQHDALLLLWRALVTCHHGPVTCHHDALTTLYDSTISVYSGQYLYFLSLD